MNSWFHATCRFCKGKSVRGAQARQCDLLHKGEKCGGELLLGAPTEQKTRPLGLRDFKRLVKKLIFEMDAVTLGHMTPGQKKAYEILVMAMKGGR